MRGARYMLLCVAILGALALLGPASAMAANCGGSAGDSQYVDPLQNCGGGHTGSTHTGSGQHSTSHVASGSSSQTGTTPVASSTTTPSTQPTAVAASTTTSSTGPGKKDPKGKGSLPFTGLDLVPALIVAAALIAGGVWLRWVGRERRPHWR